MKAKILWFDKFPNGDDKDCIAITDTWEDIILDPFVWCTWEYDKREHLLNEWVEFDWYKHPDWVWISDRNFKIIHS